MAFDFRIVFSGICAFVPRPDGSFDDLAKKKDFFRSLTVVLPDMLSAKAISKDDVRDGHLPTLELDRDQGWQGDRDVDLVAPKRQNKKDIYFLNKERVSFEFGGGTPGGIEICNFDALPPAGQTAPAAGEEEFFWWVPKMERVVPGSENLRDNLLANDLAEVRAIVSLTQGLLSVPPGSISAQEVVFLPIGIGQGQGLRQKIAFRVALDVKQVTSVKIVFGTRLPDGTEGTRSLSLTRAAGQVEIAVKNREVDDLLGVKPERTNRGDVDFHAYYDLSSTNGAEPQRLVPFEAPALIGGIGTGTTKLGGVCPPAAFSGVKVV